MKMRSVAILFALVSVAASATAKPRVMTMKASAFAQEGKTSAGTPAREGIVAADPNVLPLGTKVRITGAGAYDGVYIVTDTGRHIDGQQIDIYVPSAAEAKKFGEKMVKVTVLETGEGKQDARQKDRAGRQANKP